MARAPLWKGGNIIGYKVVVVVVVMVVVLVVVVAVVVATYGEPEKKRTSWGHIKEFCETRLIDLETFIPVPKGPLRAPNGLF